MNTKIWCYFFKECKEIDMREKLELIRCLMQYSDNEDIEIFNYLAQKEKIDLISFNEGEKWTL